MKRKRPIILAGILLAAIAFCLLTTQLQPVLLRSYRAIDGSFGVRVRSHDCLGLQVDAARLGLLPSADWRFTFGNFSFRYNMAAEFRDRHTILCIGQDLWYGE